MIRLSSLIINYQDGSILNVKVGQFYLTINTTIMNKEELIESDLEKVAGGKFPRFSPEKDLSDEDREKLKELEREISERM